MSLSIKKKNYRQMILKGNHKISTCLSTFAINYDKSGFEILGIMQGGAIPLPNNTCEVSLLNVHV